MDFDVGGRLKRLREYFHLTQMQMAEQANIDDKYYGRIERNESKPTVAMIEKICKGLEMPLAQFFMPSTKEMANDPLGEFNIQKIQAHYMAAGIDIHFNKNAILKDCSNCIWYCGYIASAYLDEFELRLCAEGNIRARIYINYEEVASINDDDASRELSKYFKTDRELQTVLIREEYSDELLKSYQGTAVFMPESNWLTLSRVDHIRGNSIHVFDLDTENIFEPFMSDGMELVDYFFS